MPMQPEPVPISATRVNEGFACSQATARSTSSSVSGRGMSTSFVRANSSPKNSHFPSTYGSGSPPSSRVIWPSRASYCLPVRWASGCAMIHERGLSITWASTTCASSPGVSLVYSNRERSSSRTASTVCSPTLIVIGLHSRGSQALGFIPRRQLFDKGVDAALHHRREVVDGYVDAVIGDAVLRIVVRADLLRPLTRAYLRTAVGF